MNKAELEVRVGELEGMIADRDETILAYKKAEQQAAPVKLIELHKNELAERDERIADLAKDQQLSSEAAGMLKAELAEAEDKINALKAGAAQPSAADGLLQLGDTEMDEDFLRDNRVDLHVIKAESGVKPVQWGTEQKLLRMVTLARDASGMGKPGTMVVRLVGIDGGMDTQMDSSMEIETKLVQRNGEYQLVRGR